MKRAIKIGVIFMFFTNVIFSQGSLSTSVIVEGDRLELKESSLIINGTSTLHDWHSTAEKSSAFLVLNNSDTLIEKLNLVVEVASIKNSKGSSTMDKITRKALKESDFPKITYEFLNAEVIENGDYELKIKMFGDLTIAGKTNKVSIVTAINKTGSEVALRGSHELKMTDFNVDPPKALFGTVQTGDEITIEFLVKF